MPYLYSTAFQSIERSDAEHTITRQKNRTVVTDVQRRTVTENGNGLETVAETRANYYTYLSKHSLLIYSGPLSARQGSWRADNGPL